MKLTKIKSKKAAIELSIGTVVIIVLAMSMLILGLVLIRNIFKGATDSVDEINEGVSSEIKKLFQDESDKSVIRLSGSEAVIEQGSQFGFVLGVRNNDATLPKDFTYDIVYIGATPSECHSLGSTTFEPWVAFPLGTLSGVDKGEIEEEIIRITIPEDAPLCTAQFKINIKEGASTYDDPQFFIRVKSKGIF